ncbi:TetR/AcrR family transcriptional regulator C-terminal domain-containing protein [Actinomycetes bacterium KLBMP 9797]
MTVERTSALPPYQRIVAEIRERIESGRLRPGDRVPSTRQITRDWGVAMATATKVIAALRDEGLVETRPGAGTVVRAPRIGGRAAARELSTDRVVRAGIAVADAEGLAALSMRRVAADLGVATMSLYRHVAGREALILSMVDTVFADAPLPDRPPPDWRARLEFAGRQMWRVFRRHPWAAEVLSMTRPQALPALLGYAEWSLGALRGLGLGVTETMHAHLTVFGFVRGTAVSLQSETLAERDTGVTNDEWADTYQPVAERVLASGRYPNLRHIMNQRFDYDLDAVFEYGLQRVLDGLATHLHDQGLLHAAITA